jgi:hypothetical protein
MYTPSQALIRICDFIPETNYQIIEVFYIYIYIYIYICIFYIVYIRVFTDISSLCNFAKCEFRQRYIRQLANFPTKFANWQKLQLAKRGIGIKTVYRYISASINRYLHDLIRSTRI